MGPVVTLRACDSYEPDTLDQALDALLEDLGGLGPILAAAPDDPVVLIKPNLLLPKPVRSGVTTHPQFIAAVARAVRRLHGGRLLVGDSPAVGPASGVARLLGLPRLLADLDVQIVDFRATAPVGGGGGFGPMDLARPLVEADVVINLPRIKTHGQMGLTMGVKNCFGAFVGVEKQQLHLSAGRDYATFARLLLEVERRVAPALTLADGVVAMEGNGPTSGDPRHLGLLAGSRDALAMDVVLADVLGFAPSELPILAEAVRQGRSSASRDAIEVRGDPAAGFAVSDWRRASAVSITQVVLPDLLALPLRHQLTTRPGFDHARCTRCGVCIEHCAAGALELEPRRRRPAGPRDSDRAIGLDLDACIRCYCCQEVCPEGAITVAEPPLVRIWRALRPVGHGS